ncbi:MAG: alpha/beta fold hydrolase [Formosimonas sp.]
MAQFVLVHGAWHGAWCWQKVLPILRGAGHEAYAVCLTGTGERAHLLNADINLRTHINDVLAEIRMQELSEVILVGHSYAGMVITGVADELLESTQHPLKHLVYLDAVTPHNGESWSSRHSDETRAARIASAAQHGGLALPVADAAVFGLAGEDLHWVNRRMTPQPFGVYQDPLHFSAPRLASVPRTFIDCNSPALKTVAIMRQRVRSEPNWQVFELETGHDAMVSAPKELCDILLKLTKDEYVD